MIGQVYKGVIYIYYDEDTNSYYDEEFGAVIYNIHEYLTPLQVYLFRKGFAASFQTEDGYLVEIICSDELEEEI